MRKISTFGKEGRENMVHFFTGTPGSGKSLHMAMVIDKQLKKGKNVIANFEINEEHLQKMGTKKHPGKARHVYLRPQHRLVKLSIQAV